MFQLSCLLVRLLSPRGLLYNISQLSNRTGSLISVQDRASTRIKTVEKFILIARALRQQNNYCAMKAVLVGINCTRGHDHGELSLMLESRPTWRTFQSLNVLLGSGRSGQAYRLALKHTTGAAIPDMCVNHLIHHISIID